VKFNNFLVSLGVSLVILKRSLSERKSFKQGEFAQATMCWIVMINDVLYVFT